MHDYTNFCAQKSMCGRHCCGFTFLQDYDMISKPWSGGKNMETKKNRHYGLDLLRIFSMLFVVILHLLGHGGALAAPSSATNYTFLWFLESLAYPAVNCFVLLSGFVGFRNEKYFPKISNILNIVFSTLFFSVLSYGLYVVFYSQAISIKQLVYAVAPILTKQYWFVSAYFAMILLSPVVNLFVHKADRKMLFIIALITLLFVLPSSLLDPFSLNNGYGALWFMLLYMLGAIIKKEDLLSKITVPTSLILIAVGLFPFWGMKLASRFLGSPFSLVAGILHSYCSPATLLMAIGWMALCAHIKTTPRTSKVISLVTPSVFSVYLIHDNPNIRQLFITGKFEFVARCNPFVACATIFASAIVIFAGCLLLDQVRILLFKLCGVPKLVSFLDQQIKSLINKVYRRFLT